MASGGRQISRCPGDGPFTSYRAKKCIKLVSSSARQCCCLPAPRMLQAIQLRAKLRRRCAKDVTGFLVGGRPFGTGQGRPRCLLRRHRQIGKQNEKSESCSSGSRGCSIGARVGGG